MWGGLLIDHGSHLKTQYIYKVGVRQASEGTFSLRTISVLISDILSIYEQLFLNVQRTYFSLVIACNTP